MKHIVYNLEYEKLAQLEVEVRFDIAESHSKLADVVRFNILDNADERIPARRHKTVMQTLKIMKREGIIKFFTDESGFEQSNTEAKFFLNKYPECIELEKTDGVYTFVYVKV